MKPLLVLALCLTATAAPLPPMPSVPVVKRPAPALSPKHASAPKTTPMVKAGGFVPASYAAAPVICTLVRDINFFGCNTNEPGCVFYDVTRVTAQQRAGVGLTLEYADTATATEWAWVAIFGPCPTARVVETEWIQPVDQRPGCRIFRARETVPETSMARSATPTIRVLSPMVRTRVIAK